MAGRGASASDASIKSVIKSYKSISLVSEGHVVTGIGEFKKSGSPSGTVAYSTTSDPFLSQAPTTPPPATRKLAT